MKPGLEVGFSPCPNDTYIFDAWVHGRIDAPLAAIPVLDDVEGLNQRAARAELPVTKLSFPALLAAGDAYVLLDSGAALGRGCGPLLVTREPGLTPADLVGRRVAIPGLATTAWLLARLAQPRLGPPLVTRFDRVLPAVEAGEADAALIIHELRFTYRARGFHPVVDLGEWWEGRSGLPIPLGAIAARRDLGPDRIRQVEEAIRASLLHARAHPADPLPYMAAHAQDMDPGVMARHVGLYVNDFSVSLGPEGHAAIAALGAAATAAGLLAPGAPAPAAPGKC